MKHVLKAAGVNIKMQHEIFFLTIVFFIQVTSENKDQTGLYTVFNSDQIENTQNIDFFFHTV